MNPLDSLELALAIWITGWWMFDGDQGGQYLMILGLLQNGIYMTFAKTCRSHNSDHKMTVENNRDRSKSSRRDLITRTILNRKPKSPCAKVATQVKAVGLSSVRMD
jgi:hypothetical protein